MHRLKKVFTLFACRMRLFLNTIESAERFSRKFCENYTSESHHTLKKKKKMRRLKKVVTLCACRMRLFLNTIESAERFSRKFYENYTTESHHTLSVLLSVVQVCHPLSEIPGPKMFQNSEFFEF